MKLIKLLKLVETVNNVVKIENNAKENKVVGEWMDETLFVHCL
jgi:hypothetical protein